MARLPDPDAFDRWSRLIDLHTLSDLTLSDFCQLHDVSTASFYQWRRKIQERQNTQQTDTPGSFLSVQVDPACRDVKVRFPCGTLIELDAQDSQNIQLVVDRLTASAAGATP